MTPPRISLASASPRRADVLSQLGLPFEVVPANVEERTAGPSARAVALENARLKAEAARPRVREGWILAADTLGEIDGQILGKPKDAADAERMLANLAGRTHRVVTAVVVERAANHARAERVEETEVTFEPLRPEHIAAYVATGEPLGKAGAYAIQGLGAALVTGLNGDYFNVVGLPIRATLDALWEAGYPLPPHLTPSA